MSHQSLILRTGLKKRLLLTLTLVHINTFAHTFMVSLTHAQGMHGSAVAAV